MKLKTVFKILIVSSIVLPALIVGTVGTLTYTNSYGNMVAEEASVAAYTSAKSQTMIFDRYAAELSVMAQSDIIKRAAGGDYNAIKDQVDGFIRSQIDSDSALIDIAIMDGNGLVVAATNEAVLKETYPSFDVLQNTAASTVHISNISLQNEKYNTDIIYIIKPLTSSNNSKGYVAAVISVDQIKTSLSSSGFLNNKGSLVFVDGNGNAVNYDGQTVRAGEWSPPADISENTLPSIGGSVKYVAFNNNGHYGSFGRIRDTSWAWYGSYPASDAAFNVMPVTLVGLVVFAVFIVIDALIAFALYRRAISPISNIIKVMDEINTEHDREKRLPSFKAVEYQIISEYFNDLLDNFYMSEEVHKTIAAMSENMLFEWDIEKQSLFVSGNFRDKFDLDYEKATIDGGNFIDSLMSEVDARHFVKDIDSLVNGSREYVENEFQVKTKSNSEIWVNIKITAILNRSGDITRLMGTVTDINNKKKSSLQLSQKASYDFLSQLYNRSTFLKELQKLLDLKRVNESYAVLFIDVDDFKFINDRYGHNVGDEVIRYVSDTVKACVGDDGIAGRFGGDEFVLCVTDAEKVSACDEFAMSIIDSLYSGYNCETVGVTLNVNASIGIAFSPEHGNEAEKLVGAADEAMYFVKKNGKSNYHVFDPEASPDLDLGNTLT